MAAIVGLLFTVESSCAAAVEVCVGHRWAHLRLGWSGWLLIISSCFCKESSFAVRSTMSMHDVALAADLILLIHTLEAVVAPRNIRTKSLGR